MNAELDYDLTPNQWEALKALRAPESRLGALHRFAIEGLITLRLAAMAGNRPVITPKGRSVLLRGSPRLWDVAA
jgi:hypothetical protein